jgi:hypothetical protein
MGLILLTCDVFKVSRFYEYPETNNATIKTIRPFSLQLLIAKKNIL